MTILKNIFAHPLTKGLDLNDPKTTELRRRIVREKKFLRKVYEEWYLQLSDSMRDTDGVVLEIGAGAGFLEEYMPGIVKSDISKTTGIDVVMDACRQFPFSDGSLSAIVGINVLHHLSDPKKFFSEASRCVRKNGCIYMIEPWVTSWSSFVYKRLHDEPYFPDAADWGFVSNGPLTSANSALPWIMFERDRRVFEREFPAWKISGISLQMPFLYLLSGGVSLRSLSPGFTFSTWKCIEKLFGPFMQRWAMFANIKLVNANK
ncbi:MAG: class I SAM-dependent methyltransferase [Candidatus Omnitrophica bacterium]|nr:class I SAM-dependent methyltransferase [Candidatus Omnitrophota bacterium]